MHARLLIQKLYHGALLLFPLIIFSSLGSTMSVPAFPGAQGFGALATGGAGGQTYEVTSLDDSGPGTFRDAVSQPRRIITFRVGGIIHLRSNIQVASDLSILGQTAPQVGITLYGRSISFSGQHNIIVRYLRLREGIQGDRGKCSVNLAHGSDMIFDHVSIEWGRWDCLDLTQGSHDITFQNCIIGEGIAPQHFGALVDSVTDVTFSHNLWIDNKSRNPKSKGTVQYINNIVYNWGVNGLVGGHSASVHAVDVIGNYFIKGPSSSGRFAGLFTSTDRVFFLNNEADLGGSGKLKGRPISREDFCRASGSPVLAPAPQLRPAVEVTVDSPEVALKKVAEDAGCSRQRDAVDKALVDQLKSMGIAGSIIPSETNFFNPGPS